MTLRTIAGLLVLYAGLIALPHALTFSLKEVAVFLVLNVLLVTSYRLLTLTGEFSLAHVVLMGVGSYASALLAKDLAVPVILAIAMGACTAAAVAFVLSFPLFRMKGFYFLIGSFAAGEAIRLIWKKFRFPFGGSQGLNLVPTFPDISLGGWTVSFFAPTNYYYLCLLVVSAALLVLYRIERSRIGLVFHAIHWQDTLAASVGIDTWRYRTLAFVVASFFAGLTGALTVHYLGTINPNQFEVTHMVFVLIWVIVGGVTRFYGPILGVVVLTLLNEVVLRWFGLEAMRPLFYGVILIATMLFLPQGLDSLMPRLREFVAARRARTARAVAGEAPEAYDRTTPS